MQSNLYTIQYPRNSLFRGVAKRVVRVLLKLFARLTVEGLEKIPQSGPAILAVNHVHVLEVALTVAIPNRQVELIGNGDIPFDPSYGWLANAYGFIPVKRGSLDREALQMGMDVLRQGGLLGIFPEGGIWDQANMEPQIGVSLIAQRTQTSVIPVACGGMKGAIRQVLRLKHPIITMKVGEAIPPPPPSASYNKEALKAHASLILREIQELLPEAERGSISEGENYSVTNLDIEGSEALEGGLPESEAIVLAKLLSTPSFLEILDYNLKLPVEPMQTPEKLWKAAHWRRSIDSLLSYDSENPGFFRYRFGIEGGLQMGSALRRLRKFIERASNLRKTLRLRVQRFRRFKNGEESTTVLEYEILPDN
ncbi:MAG TPA: lysophospholipid acyltransferase family protein [Anaerolineaceae bacterium]|nr:lysophospholipid acyltransferase family protein [Anaerolineaceae bacterium]